MIKPTKVSHSFEPIAAKTFLRGSQDIPRYWARQVSFRKVKSALTDIPQQVDECRRALTLIETGVKTWVDERRAELAVLECRLQHDLRECADILDRIQFLPNIPINTRLDLLVESGLGDNEDEMKREMTLFSFKTAEIEEIKVFLNERTSLMLASVPQLRKPEEPVNYFKYKSISEEEKQEIKECFDIFDNGSGRLSVKDLKKTIDESETWQKQFSFRRLLDTYEGEFLDWYGFLAIWNYPDPNSSDPNSQFRLFDSDDSGTINFTKLKRVAMELGESMTDDELQNIIDRIGRDGEISKADFLALMSDKK